MVEELEQLLIRSLQFVTNPISPEHLVIFVALEIVDGSLPVAIETGTETGTPALEDHHVEGPP